MVVQAGHRQYTVVCTVLNKTIIVPIQPGSINSREKPIFIMQASLLSEPSRALMKRSFPLLGGFAITVDKAQGQTLDRVIVALSMREHQISNFTYACIYVASSRVRKSKHMRLLLKRKEEDPAYEWSLGLLYMTQLKRSPSIKAFFDGFDKNQSNWKQNKWNQERAMQSYLAVPLHAPIHT